MFIFIYVLYLKPISSYIEKALILLVYNLYLELKASIVVSLVLITHNKILMAEEHQKPY